MEINTLKLCGFAVIGAAGAMVLRELRREFELPMRLTVTVGLLTVCVAMAKPIVKYATDLFGLSPISGEAATLVMRTLGIAIMTKLGADFCRDLGSASVAATLETAGKIEMILLSLPLLSSALDTIGALIS
jgi:stage III sporulation protein AD